MRSSRRPRRRRPEPSSFSRRKGPGSRLGLRASFLLCAGICVHARGPGFSFALQDVKPEDRLLVWDEISGNAHSLAVKELKSPWPLKPESFGFAAKVEVRVEYKGRPVETAQVEIDDGAGSKPN